MPPAQQPACAVAIADKLKSGGLVILNNSDWYPNTAKVLRDHGLIQVDYPDFRPDHWYRCNTSLFLHPKFRPKPFDGRLLRPVLGGKDLAATSRWDLTA